MTERLVIEELLKYLRWVFNDREESKERREMAFELTVKLRNFIRLGEENSK